MYPKNNIIENKINYFMKKSRWVPAWCVINLCNIKIIQHIPFYLDYNKYDKITNKCQLLPSR